MLTSHNNTERPVSKRTRSLLVDAIAVRMKWGGGGGTQVVDAGLARAGRRTLCAHVCKHGDDVTRMCHT